MSFVFAYKGGNLFVTVAQLHDHSSYGKCSRLRFVFGSSSSGAFPRSGFRFHPSNTYNRDFPTKVCNSKFGCTVDEIMCFTVVMFYVEHTLWSK